MPRIKEFCPSLWPGAGVRLDPMRSSMSGSVSAQRVPMPSGSSGRYWSRTSNVPKPYLFGSAVLRAKDPIRWESHYHEDHELLWPLDGVIAVEAGRRAWTAGPGQGIWLRSGVHHAVTAARPVSFGLTNVPMGVPEFGSVGTGAVVVADAARELLLYMNRQELVEPVRLRFQRVCLDLLKAPEAVRPGVPLPQDARLKRMVAMLFHDPADLRSIHEWGSLLHLSGRTVNRILLDEIDMTFTQWRRMLRIEHARSLLAAGETVTGTGRKVGYTSTSAFIAAFRRVIGTTPGCSGASAGHLCPESGHRESTAVR